MDKSDYWKRETLIIAQRLIDELDEPKLYEPSIHSNLLYRYMKIYNRLTHDSVLCIQAPTYYDLYMAVMGAWNAHVLLKRGC